MDHRTNQSGAPRREKSIWPMFAGAFIMFGMFALAVQWMLGTGDREAYDEEALRAKSRQEILARVQEENKELTTGYAWVDREKGAVRIPVDRAMELAVSKLSTQGDPRPAYPVEPASVLGAALKPGGLAVAQPTPPPFAAPTVPEPEFEPEESSDMGEETEVPAMEEAQP